MKLLKRLYLKEFLTAFTVVALGLSVMLSAFSLMNALGSLRDKATEGLLLYAALVLPQYLVYTMPMAALFAALFTVGQAGKNRETIAVMAAGARMRTLFLPLAVAGALLSLASFGLSQFTAPAAMRRAKAMTGQSGAAFNEGTVWARADDGSLVRFGLYSKEQASAGKVDIFLFKNGTLSGRIEAQGAKYKDGRWVLENVMRYGFIHPRAVSAARMEIAGKNLIKPDFLARQVLTSDEMGITELYRYSRRLKEAGIRSVKLDVDMNSRLAYPLVNFIMILFAIAISLGRGLGGLAAASVGMAVSLLYWLVYTFSLSLGYSGLLPPFAAAWTIPLSFGAFSLWMFLRVRD